MRRIALVALLGAALLVATTAALAGNGPASRSTDSIWIVGPVGAAPTQMTYGMNFNAGYTSKASNPVGLAQCWANSSTVLAHPTTGPFWSEYRFVQADGTIGVFNLDDPVLNEWLGGGADCTLSLQQVRSNGTIVNLATINFTVAG